MTDVSGLALLGRLLPTLVLLLAALFVVRWYSQRAARTSGVEAVRVLSRTGLARGAMLATVEVGTRHLLLGVTEHGINLITELDPGDSSGDDELDLQRFTTQMTPQRTGDFGVGLSSLAGARGGVQGGVGTDRPRMGLVDRLRDMTVRTQPTGPIRALRR